MRTSIVGASIGANMPLLTAAAEKSVRGVVLLSPGLDYEGVSAEKALVAYGFRRPLQIVVSTEDSYSREAAMTLKALADCEVESKSYERIGRGTEMLKPETGVAERSFSRRNMAQT